MQPSYAAVVKNEAIPPNGEPKTPEPVEAVEAVDLTGVMPGKACEPRKANAEVARASLAQSTRMSLI